MERAGNLGEPAFQQAMACVLEVLPVGRAFSGIALDGDLAAASGDFEALENLRRLALPDRPGNNRIDSLRNVATNPRVALMFLAPGIEEVLRVFGTATIVGPDSLGLDLTEFGRAPLSVLVMTVRRAFFQCPKSVMRSGLWDPEQRVAPTTLTPFGRVIKDHCALEADLPDDATIWADLRQEL